MKSYGIIMSLFVYVCVGGGAGGTIVCWSVGVGDRMRKIAVYKNYWGIKLAIHDISQNSVKVNYRIYPYKHPPPY